MTAEPIRVEAIEPERIFSLSLREVHQAINRMHHSGEKALEHWRPERPIVFGTALAWKDGKTFRLEHLGRCFVAARNYGLYELKKLLWACYENGRLPDKEDEYWEAMEAAVRKAKFLNRLDITFLDDLSRELGSEAGMRFQIHGDWKVSLFKDQTIDSQLEDYTPNGWHLPEDLLRSPYTKEVWTRALGDHFPGYLLIT